MENNHLNFEFRTLRTQAAIREKLLLIKKNINQRNEQR